MATINFDFPLMLNASSLFKQKRHRNSILVPFLLVDKQNSSLTEAGKGIRTPDIQLGKLTFYH